MSKNDLSFASIIGQDKAKEMLRRAISQGKTAHAFLFRGPAGVGKKTTAQAFAAALNCASPVAAGACGTCSSCRKIASGNHPDIVTIAPDGAFIKINQIRALAQELSFPPYEARFRVVLIHEAQAMRQEAANSLLKTLEEPPRHSILILTADDGHSILPTIVSRCQVVSFFPLSYPAVAERLMAEQEIGHDEAQAVAAVAEGSLGRARLLLESGLLPLRHEIISELTARSQDDPDTVQAVFSLAEKASALKEEIDELLDLLKLWIRDLVLLHSGQGQRILNHDLAPALAAATERWNLDELSAKLRLINQAKQQLARNCNRTLVCESLFFGLL